MHSSNLLERSTLECADRNSQSDGEQMSICTISMLVMSLNTQPGRVTAVAIILQVIGT